VKGVSTTLFNSTTLFRRMWPKLLPCTAGAPFAFWFWLAVVVLPCSRGLAQFNPVWNIGSYGGSTIVEPNTKTSPVVFPFDPNASIGVTLGVSVRQWGVPGYHWVEVSIDSPTVVSADRSFVIRFQTCPEGSVPISRNVQIDIPLTLVQGQRSVRHTAYLPCYCVPAGLGVQLLEDDQVADGYTGVIPANNVGLVGQSLGGLDDLIISNKDFDALTIDENFSLQQPSWQTFECFDVVRIKTSLETICKNDELKLALTDYLMCGGTVWLPSDADIDQSLKQLGIKASPSKTGEGVGAVNQFDGFKMYSVGVGFIVQFPPKSNAPVATTFSQVFPIRSSRIVRTGVDPILGDSRFDYWTVPGVAQPPVYTFMGLLTVFVIFVGPVAYRYTTKRGRGYLMFAIAPILAFATTFAMFAYGIFADGFGTQARIRQLTYVDGVSGHGGERIRSTYFSGIRPQNGLDFGSDSIVFPYRDSYGTSWENLLTQSPTGIHLIELDSDVQNFSSSFLPSRRQEGFVVTRPRRSIGRLRLDSSVPPVATSEFDFELRDVVVRDAEGKDWFVDSIPAGASVPCYAPKEKMDVSKRLGGLYNDHSLTDSIARTRNNGPANTLETRDLIANLNQMVGATSIVLGGSFENYLVNLIKNNPTLPSGTFVALADVSPDAVAVKDAKLKKSIRYVFGTLP
jgi:hypothetical protein